MPNDNQNSITLTINRIRIDSVDAGDLSCYCAACNCAECIGKDGWDYGWEDGWEDGWDYAVTEEWDTSRWDEA
jgi:hypothetical protein